MRIVVKEAELLPFCFKCRNELLKEDTCCHACGEHIESPVGQQVSVSISSGVHISSKVGINTRCAHIPVAVFQTGLPVTDELEKAAMTTIAFRQVAQPVFRRQLAVISIGTLIAVLFALIAVISSSYAFLVVCFCCFLSIIYGVTLKPRAELRLSKVYSSLASVPFGTSKLVFDLNGCLGHEEFDYVTLPIHEISSKLREFPEDLAIENEELLLAKLSEISAAVQHQKKESISIPLLARGHPTATCIFEVLDGCVDGKPNGELPRSIGLEDCLRQAELLNSIEKESTDIATFLDKSVSQCSAASEPFVKRLERNLDTVGRYFDGLLKCVDERLFGGIDYDKRKDDDVADVVTYDVSRLPDFANIVRPFQTVIDSIYKPIRFEIDRSRKEFEIEKGRLLHEQDSEQERIDVDTEREIRQLRVDLESAKRQVTEARNRRNNAKSETLAEERAQRRKEPEGQNWSHARALRKKLNLSEKELKAAEAVVDRIMGTINEANSASRQNKARIRKKMEKSMNELQDRLADDVRTLKMPVIKLEKERDHIIDVGRSLLSSLKLEREMQETPYLERRQRLMQLRDETVSKLRREAESRVALINKIDRMKIDFPISHPIEIEIPFWVLEVKYNENSAMKYWFGIWDLVSPQQTAKPWVRDFADFTVPRPSFSSYVAYLESHDFARKDIHPLTPRDMWHAAKRAESFVNDGLLSSRCHSKMLDFFGESLE